MNFNISDNKPIVAIWGVQDGSGYPKSGWSEFCPTHDHSFCVLKENRIDNYLELERVTRSKHDRRLSAYIEKLDQYLPEDFIVVCVNHYAGNSFISNNGMWRIESEGLRVSELIRPAHAYVNHVEREAYICSHELAHIGAILPFVGEFRENSLLVHIDGLASESCFSVFHYVNGTIKYIYHGWEPLEATQIFGFNDMTCSMLGLDENHRLAVPGRLMGYSSYGSDGNEIRKWLKENKWFAGFWKDHNHFFEDISQIYQEEIVNFDLKKQCFMDIAASCQREFEDVILGLMKQYQSLTNAEYLYYSGGAALNIDLNTRLIDSHLFRKVYIPPCCSDTGLALGGAAIVNLLRGNKMNIHSPFINSVGVKEKSVKPLDNELLENIVIRLAQGQVMGTCIGLAECGPRALGHRSIMGIPTSQRMYKRINTEIKQREWYRPLAPIILDKLADKVFDYVSEFEELSQFMLLNCVVKNSWLGEIPAIVHVNKTARVQVVHKDDVDLAPIYQILDRLWTDKRIPCLINTSFNGQGEPIVHTDQDALETGKRVGLDFILFDDKIVDLRNLG